MRLIYVVDPMCAWCYGFQPQLDALLNRMPSATIEWVMGGLAPDNTSPMTMEMRQTISAYWHQIEAKTDVEFNHDYWRINTPYRSTYQACRAVIAANTLIEGSADAMVKAIQTAYYQKAQNPSLDKTLIECAESIGLDDKLFAALMNSNEIQQQLTQHLHIAMQLGATGFPALFYVNNANHAFPLTHGYCLADELAQRLTLILQREKEPISNRHTQITGIT